MLISVSSKAGVVGLICLVGRRRKKVKYKQVWIPVLKGKVLPFHDIKW